MADFEGKNAEAASKGQHLALKVSNGSDMGTSSLSEEPAKEWIQEMQQRGMQITFRNLEYFVRNRAKKTERLSILKGISGYYLPAEMAAVMGPSGSGKSTHLDILAGRKTVGEIRGSISFGGQKATSSFLKRFTGFDPNWSEINLLNTRLQDKFPNGILLSRDSVKGVVRWISGYVEQFDTLLPELTVAEMLLYTAELKCPISEPLKSKKERVEKLLDLLALQSCKNTHIGDSLARGISGGQAKRTNVGIALITNPRVLFLDEPTSGLDSFTAHEVMRVVKGLSSQGITIVATIHCPPPHTFRLFDRVLILQQGALVYFGLNGHAASSFFCRHYQKLRARPDEENLAEWLVDITSEAERQGSDKFVVGYAASTLKHENDERLEEFLAEEERNIPSAEIQQALGVKAATGTPMWKGLEVMLKYRTRNNYMSGYYLFGRLFDKLMFTLFTFAYYWHVGKNDSSSNAPNIAGLLFMWAILPAWGAGPYLPALVLERPIFVREMSDGLYTAFTYLTYKMIEELFMAVLMSVAFAFPIYYFCELQGSFFVVWLVWLVSLADGIAFAYATAAISPTMDIANCALLTVPTVLLYGCGYMLRWNAIPRYLLWLSYVNWLQYAWGALMVNQFKGKNVKVYGEEEILDYYSLDEVSMWAYVGYEALFVLFFLGLCWIALTMLRHQKR